MKVVLCGGSGQVGQVLARAWTSKGHDVVVLARGAAKTGRVVAWDGRTAGEWEREIDGSDVVVNLAGRSVDCRYTPAHLEEMRASRVLSAEAVGRAIARATNPPRAWLQMSTATIYAHRFDAANDEATGVIGGGEPGAPELWDASIAIAKAWERALEQAPTPRTRKVALRTAMVMSPDRGGVFDVLLRLVRFGLGGPIAGGRQFISWIHHGDFVAACEFLIGHDEIEGAVSVASPNPLPQRDFMKALRTAWGMPIGLPATRWMIEVGTWMLRTESELVLKSRRVVPRRLLDAGFAFGHPKWDEAARNLVDEWRGRTPRLEKQAASG